MIQTQTNKLLCSMKRSRALRAGGLPRSGCDRVHHIFGRWSNEIVFCWGRETNLEIGPWAMMAVQQRHKSAFLSGPAEQRYLTEDGQHFSCFHKVNWTFCLYQVLFYEEAGSTNIWIHARGPWSFINTSSWLSSWNIKKQKWAGQFNNSILQDGSNTMNLSPCVVEYVFNFPHRWCL